MWKQIENNGSPQGGAGERLDMEKLKELPVSTGKECLNLFFKGYFDFKGRTWRAVFWQSLLLFYGIICCLSMPALVCLIGDWLDESFRIAFGMFMGPVCLFVLARIIPSWALIFRRFPDVGLSGLWALVLGALLVIPFVNCAAFIALLVIFVGFSSPNPISGGHPPKYISETA